MINNSMMKKFGTRKTVLLALIAVLLLVFILSICISGSNDGYRLSVKKGIDSITIQKSEGDPIVLVNKDGKWFLKSASENGEESEIPANEDFVKQMTDFFEKTEVIGKISRNGDDERFGFGSSSSFSVTAQKDGKVVRKFEFGKKSISYQQMYARIDGSKEVVLVGSNPQIFDRTFEQLKAQIDTDIE